jgi:tryptophanyl-tRNA synthetase
VSKAESMRELGAKVSKKLPSRLIEVTDPEKKTEDKIKAISSRE